jgi:DNA-binding PadR family transcriptional regulator
MNFKLAKVNHFRLLATIIAKKELNHKEVVNSLPFKEPNLISYLTFLTKHKLIEARRDDKHNANFIFYSPTQSGIDLLESFRAALDISHQHHE